jgi:hypothetical protein
LLGKVFKNFLEAFPKVRWSLGRREPRRWRMKPDRMQGRSEAFSMESLVNLLVERIGITQEQATQAVGLIVEHLKKAHPEFEQALERLLSNREGFASAAEKLAPWVGKVGELFKTKDS